MTGPVRQGTALALALALAGCEPPRLPVPTVTGVTPGRVWNGADIPIVIEGTDFLPRIDVDARGFGADLEGEWTVDLVADDGTVVGLTGVSRQDAEHLIAVVGAGAPPGDYSLHVTGPSRETVVTEPLLEVSTSQEVGLRVDYYDPPTTYAAGERVRFLFEAVGFDNERVFTDVPVLITLSGPRIEIPHTAEFEEVQFLPLDDGVGFVGVLPEGQSILPVDLRAPGRLDVVARSAPGVPELQEGTLTLFIDGGSELPAELRLPEGPATGTGTGTAPFVAKAGEAFQLGVTVRDADGEAILQEPLELVLGNACGTLRQTVVVDGVTQVPVTVEQATDPEGVCVADAIEVLSGAVGASASFEVEGGEPAYFELDLIQSEVRAGDGVLLLVRPTDAFGNTTEWKGDLEVTDDLGSLTEVSCAAGERFLLCSAIATLAADPLTITAAGDGLVGSATGLVVRPAATTAGLALSGPTAGVAGVSESVGVTFLDAWGNPQESDDIDPGMLLLTDELGDVDCALDAVVGSESVYGCVFTVARDTAVLEVDGFGTQASTDPFVVVNADLAVVQLTAPSAVIAGDSFELQLFGSDAYGNPYLEQADPVVQLRDDLGGLGVSEVTLDTNGSGRVATSLIRSGTTQIRASQADVDLGASGSIDVSAGPTTALSVTPSEPWGYVGVPVDVTVQAVDAFGNRTGVAGQVTLSSRRTSTPDLPLSLVNGVATVPWTWADDALDEELEATADAGFTGSSGVLYVVRACADGPDAVFDFGGFPEALACLDPGTGHALVSAGLGSSVAGGAPLAGYALAADGGPATLGALPDLDFTLETVGPHVVRGLAVQSDGCADETQGVAWVGPDDGTPTGPIALSVDVDPLALFDLATVSLDDVRDCARDVAAGASVRLRTTAGVLLDVSPSGEGLEVVLDALGDGATDLETDGGLAGDAVEVHAWVASGAASGVVTVGLVGDEISPTVVEQDPAGGTSDLVDAVTLTFSEPLLGATVLPSRFTLDGPTGAVADAVLSGDGTEVTLTLAPAVDGAAGVHTLTASRELRDLAGRRLAGTWDEVAADYVSTLGGTAAVVDPVSCSAGAPPGGVFRPDGDDGVGAEADAWSVALESSFPPAWWVVDVRDAAGVRVRQDWDVPLGAVDAWVWDGRDDEGLIVPNGSYSVTVSPDDGAGNRGPACVVQVTVDNRLGGVPGLSEAP